MKIDFNETEIDSINKTIRKLKKIKEELMLKPPPEPRISNTLRGEEKIFESFNAILESDISSIYGESGSGEYYVYFHCDPNIPIVATKNSKNLFAAQIGLQFKPFYVGKGIGDRCYDTTRNDSYAKKKQQIAKTNKEILVIKVKESLNEPASLALESKFIDIFGITAYHPFNWLLNLDEGKYKDDRRDKYIKGSKYAIRKNRMILN